MPWGDLYAGLTPRSAFSYLCVGGYNTAFGYAAFVAANLLLGHRVNYLILLVGSTVVATINAFFAYRWIIFKVKGFLLRDLARFSTVYLGILGINLALLPVLVELVGLPVLVAQAMLTVVNVAVSYLGHRNFSFRRATPQ